MPKISIYFITCKYILNYIHIYSEMILARYVNSIYYQNFVLFGIDRSFCDKYGSSDISSDTTAIVKRSC